MVEGTADGRGEGRKAGSADGGGTFVRAELLDIDASETEKKTIQWHIKIHKQEVKVQRKHNMTAR